MRFIPVLFALLPLFAQTPSADLFLSLQGNDSWSGTLPAPNATRTDGPFASVARAQMALRELLENQAREIAHGHAA